LNAAVLPHAPLEPAAVRSIIVGLMLAILLGALDQTIVSVALPRMAEQLHGFDLLAWVVSGYLVASTVATPIYGKLGDLFGRRIMLLSAIALFLIASLGCALAQSMPELVGARVIQGLGGGGLISISQTIIADVVSLRERGRYQGYISGVYAVSSVAGPVVGGLLTHYLSWRWCFWINLVLGPLAFLVSRRALARLPVPGVRRPIDYLGALLLSAGLAALLIAITRVGQGLPWNERPNLALLGSAGVILALFIVWERRAAEPIVPLPLFKIPAVALCCAVLFLAYFNLIAISVLLPLRFQIVAGVGADSAAWRLVPLSLMIPCGAFCAGRVMVKTGRYRPVQMAGAAIVPLALLAIGLVDVHSISLTALAMAAAGLGIGLQFPSSLVAVQNAVPPHNIGVATAATALFRSLGGAIGIAVLSTILLASLHSGAAITGTSEVGGAMLHSILGTAASADAAGDRAIRALAEEAFLRIVLVGAAVALVPFGLTFLVPDSTLSARIKTEPESPPAGTQEGAGLARGRPS
jgi:EmrB/QacA subfamily drug resistance transporter